MEDQSCVCWRGCFSVGAAAPDSGRLRTAPRGSNPGVVVGCRSLGSALGAAIGAAAARGGAAAGLVGAGATTAGVGTSTLRAPVLRSTLAVSVRAESASAETAGAPGCERCAGKYPSGARGAGTPKMVLVALSREAVIGAGAAVAVGAAAGGATRGATGAGATTGTGVTTRGAAGWLPERAASAADLLASLLASLAASAAARALATSATGIPKIVLVELAFRAAWAEGAGAGTGAGVAVADLARFGALAGSLNPGTTSR